MKIELIKETEVNGKVWYMICVNGCCKISFHEKEYEMAKECYEKAVSLGSWSVKEVLESKIIGDEETN